MDTDNIHSFDINCNILKSEADWSRAFPVMRELRDHLSEQEYLSNLREMTSQGYRLLSLEKNGQILSLAGIIRLTNFYYGRHIWVYDLVTSPSERSKGYGLQLLEYVEKIALDEDCIVIALSSGLAREHSHRFYIERAGYKKVSYVFRKSL